jgi:putative ABC transport system ATP-binding protein
MSDEIETPPHAPAKRPDGEVVFEVRGLTKIYHMGEIQVHALRGIDLEFYRGEFLMRFGPSGSGNATRLDILGGRDVPSAGTANYSGRELTVDDESELTRCRRLHVGFVFQFYNLIPSLTARTA